MQTEPVNLTAQLPAVLCLACGAESRKVVRSERHQLRS